MTRRQKRVLYRILIAAALMAGALILPVGGWMRLCAFLIPYAVIGYDVLQRAGSNILRGQVFDEQFLMALATLGAFAVGEYPEGVLVMLFYQVGELFQSIAVGRSRKSIASLMDIRPDRAIVLRNGEEQEVSPEEVELGATIIVRPGEKIPLDGIILKGDTTVDTAALTGESLPLDRKSGETVISGSVNLTGVIEVTVTKRFEESTVSKILELVENSAIKKAKAERFITRFARYYTPCVVVGALLLALIPPLFWGNWSEWIHRALIFLVVSCPCALVISVPLSFFGGIGGASRKGILVKGANYLERLSNIKTIVFDKTGTLTKGCFEVSSVESVSMEKEKLLEYAALAESHSNHPIAQSICRSYGKEIDGARLGEVQELSGKGLLAMVDGRQVAAGNRTLLTSIGVAAPELDVFGTVVYMAIDGQYAGAIVVSDLPKEEAERDLKVLRSAGVERLVMLTGDRVSVGCAIGEMLGMDEIHAELLPDQKVACMENFLENSRGPVAFVGDGINDAPVLTRADIGIAMGALGSDAAIEAADVVLMDDQLSKIAEAVRISRKTMRIVRQNIVFSLAVKGLVLLFSALGWSGMGLAIFADVGVMVIAILNSMRTLKGEK